MTTNVRLLGRDAILEVELGENARGQEQGQYMVDHARPPARESGSSRTTTARSEPPRDGQGPRAPAPTARAIRAASSRRDRRRNRPSRMAQHPVEQALAPAGTIAEGGLQRRPGRGRSDNSRHGRAMSGSSLRRSRRAEPWRPVEARAPLRSRRRSTPRAIISTTRR